MKALYKYRLAVLMMAASVSMTSCATTAQADAGPCSKDGRYNTAVRG